ncbi:hypothetical protein [Hymenobacter jeollabukensis]|uniref:DUF4476 domain-containing protein n=1 Tax=Hymenobacter jeollabukensis TaxID=2025313 RepID=A0A5R8WIG6_9BACT|nr:hypothetical protein [Hymenobacter jeollabukensis]TLM87904.1 hypothetical protein FDY95_25000 [Hymenobacter jeollabukensis]
MKHALLLALALLLTVGAARAQAPASPAAAPAATVPANVETDFLAVANAAAGLMKRLMAQPATAAAEAPLLRECNALCQRGRRVTPAYAQWLRGLSRPELQTAVQHLKASAFVQYFGPLQYDPQFEARYKRSPAAADMMLALLNALDFERQ